MNKEINIIFAPFKCTGCERAKKLLPKFCKENGWDYKIVETEENLEYYPLIYATVDKKIVYTLEGFSLKKLRNN